MNVSYEEQDKFIGDMTNFLKHPFLVGKTYCCMLECINKNLYDDKLEWVTPVIEKSRELIAIGNEQIKILRETDDKLEKLDKTSEQYKEMNKAVNMAMINVPMIFKQATEMNKILGKSVDRAINIHFGTVPVDKALHRKINKALQSVNLDKEDTSFVKLENFLKKHKPNVKYVPKPMSEK